MTASKIKASVLNAPNYNGSPKIIEEPDFKEAILAAHLAASADDIVVLSPASTSFDRFKNFEERGNTYKEIVNGLK
jgi:UDP-N-acetylmuramoylalanine--D-glutamate ligase